MVCRTYDIHPSILSIIPPLSTYRLLCTLHLTALHCMTVYHPTTATTRTTRTARTTTVSHSCPRCLSTLLPRPNCYIYILVESYLFKAFRVTLPFLSYCLIISSPDTSVIFQSSDSAGQIITTRLLTWHARRFNEHTMK